MKNTLRLAFLFILLIASCHAAEVRYDIEAAIENKGGCPILFIKYINKGSAPMYFQPEEPMISVVDRSNKVAAFTGPLVKRPEYSSGDYKRITPGMVFVREINIAFSYEIGKSGVYKAVVNSDYFDPISLKGYENKDIDIYFFYNGECRR